MIVRSHLRWPLRGAVAAVVPGFSAAIALLAFEFCKGTAGLDRDAKPELAQLRTEVSRLKSGHAPARQVSGTAESLLTAERTAQVRLAQHLRQLEVDKLPLQADLGVFERLLPTNGEGLHLRGLQARAKGPGPFRHQMLVVHNGKPTTEFNGRYELPATRVLEGKPWSQPFAGGPKTLQLRQHAQVEGTIDHPPAAVMRAVQAPLFDDQGATRAAQSVKVMP